MRSMSSTAATGFSWKLDQSKGRRWAYAYLVNLVAHFKVLGSHKDRPLHLLRWVRGVFDRYGFNLDVHILWREIIIVFFK